MGCKIYVDMSPFLDGDVFHIIRLKIILNSVYSLIYMMGYRRLAF